jgi:hypothetical protein
MIGAGDGCGDSMIGVPLGGAAMIKINPRAASVNRILKAIVSSRSFMYRFFSIRSGISVNYAFESEGTIGLGEPNPFGAVLGRFLFQYNHLISCESSNMRLFEDEKNEEDSSGIFREY